MKKILSFLFLLFVPFMVKAADIEIKSITLLEKVGDVEVKSDPKIEGTNINFDLAFTNVDDSVKYKVVVKNTANEDLEINDESQYGANKYIKYEIVLGKESRTIKAGAEKEFTVIVTYDKEIPTEEFDNGVYNEKGSVSISLTSEKENPKTSAFITIIVVIAGISLITGILVHRGMKKTAISTVVLSLVVLPISINALREVKFDISSKVEIIDRCYTLDTTFGSFDESKEVKSVCVPFAENKYFIEEEYYTVQWGQRHLDTDNLILNVYRNHFTKESYVKVYDENDNLLKEVTLSDFPKPLLNVRTTINYGFQHLNISLGNRNGADLRIEVSEDLQAYTNEAPGVAYFMYSGKPGKITTKGPWIKDVDAMAKVETLREHGTEEYVLKGFEKDAKDSHLYHAVWGVPSTDK